MVSPSEFLNDNIAKEKREKANKGEKSQKCDQCDYASVQEGNLREHFKVHSGGKSYK